MEGEQENHQCLPRVGSCVLLSTSGSGHDPEMPGPVYGKALCVLARGQTWNLPPPGPQGHLDKRSEKGF